MNLTVNQWIAIIMAVLGVLNGATAQLTDLVGAGAAHLIVTLASLSTSILAAILAATSGQSNLVRAVQGMPGVEKIVVNKDANQTLASLAVDEAQPKIEALPSAEAKVTQTAKGK